MGLDPILFKVGYTVIIFTLFFRLSIQEAIRIDTKYGNGTKRGFWVKRTIELVAISVITLLIWFM